MRSKHLGSERLRKALFLKSLPRQVDGVRSEDRDSQKVPPAEITGAVFSGRPAHSTAARGERRLGVAPDFPALLSAPSETGFLVEATSV